MVKMASTAIPPGSRNTPSPACSPSRTTTSRFPRRADQQRHQRADLTRRIVSRAVALALENEDYRRLNAQFFDARCRMKQEIDAPGKTLLYAYGNSRSHPNSAKSGGLAQGRAAQIRGQREAGGPGLASRECRRAQGASFGSDKSVHWKAARIDRVPAFGSGAGNGLPRRSHPSAGQNSFQRRRALVVSRGIV